MSELDIDAALIAAVLNGGLAMDVIHENGSYSTWDGVSYSNVDGVYTPSADREHMEIMNFPASVAPLSMADSDEVSGLFQAIIKYPADTGAVATKAKAWAFLALFPMGAALTYSGQNVYPTSKNMDRGRTEGGFYQIVCRVEYRAFVPR